MNTAHAAQQSTQDTAVRLDGSAFQQRLERLCQALGVPGGRLISLMGSEHSVIAAVGEQATGLADLEREAARKGVPHIIAQYSSGIGFYAGLTLPDVDGSASMLLSLFDRQPRSEAVAHAIAATAGEILASATIRRQARLIEQHEAVIANFTALEEQHRSLFDRASATARIGIWQFNLVERTLFWTDGVYDIFELPRKMPITRYTALQYYKPDSLHAMEARREQAIANCSEFSLDIEIVTAKGNQRWVRLTGAVEARDGVAHRIFGVKQDITEEKLLTERTRYLAEFDVMTGLANRGRFQALLDELQPDQMGALLLVDLDGFKQVNDTHGHAVGDACLKEAADRLLACCPDAIVVSRIGGDEFAVLTKPSLSRDKAEDLARTIVATIARPVDFLRDASILGASVGVAHAGQGSCQDLFRHADAALYAAKAAGRNTSRTYGAA